MPGGHQLAHRQRWSRLVQIQEWVASTACVPPVYRWRQRTFRLPPPATCPGAAPHQLGLRAQFNCACCPHHPVRPAIERAQYNCASCPYHLARRAPPNSHRPRRRYASADARVIQRGQASCASQYVRDAAAAGCAGDRGGRGIEDPSLGRAEPLTARPSWPITVVPALGPGGILMVSRTRRLLSDGVRGGTAWRSSAAR